MHILENEISQLNLPSDLDFQEGIRPELRVTQQVSLIPPPYCIKVQSLQWT
jgi:hypothetical protein